MSAANPFPDGLDALRVEIGLEEIASLIERTARWVAAETFNLLPVWYPEHARGAFFYKGDWSEPQNNKTRATGVIVHKRESNTYANKALTLALGMRSGDRPNWSCCHIWGVDDARYVTNNAVVQDRRFYSCVANMVLLPTPLKAFTDVMPEIKAMLRLCASNLYGWRCDHDSLVADPKLEAWAEHPAYPLSWPRGLHCNDPMGTMPLTQTVRDAAQRRLAQICRDLREAGPEYPREQVRAALDYWGVQVA